MRARLLAVVLLVCLLSCGTCLAQELAIRAGSVVDPATGTVAKNQVILVKGGKIAGIGSGLRIPAGAEVIDLSSAWVMPGLMDAHTHLTLGGPVIELLEATYLKESTGLRLLRGVRNARNVLEAGFTVIRDVGIAANYADTDLRRGIELGWFSGPTILNTGKIIAAFGGQSHGVPAEIGPFWQFEYIDADTPDEVRKAVRRNIYYGANAIKLVADNSAFHYSVEEIRAAVSEAHAAGLTVAVHVYGGEAARNVILGGADSIEHGFELDDDLLRLMKEKGTVLVGTDFPLEHLVPMGPVGGLVPDPKALSERIVNRLRRAHRVGVKLAFGTDTVIDPRDKTRAEMMLDYLDVWLAAGIPPAEILKAMTTNAAELFRLKGVRGAIAPGQAADIIATPDNPLENIKTLRKVSFVMKDGKVIRRGR